MTEAEDTTLSPRDITKQRILELIVGGVKTKREIAEQAGVSRPTLNKYLKEINKNEIIEAELESLKDELIPYLREQAQNPDSPIQKAAIDNTMKWMLKLKDKESPDLKQNININIDLTRYQKNEQLHNEAIARLPPHMRQQYIENIKTIQQEWNW